MSRLSLSQENRQVPQAPLTGRRERWLWRGTVLCMIGLLPAAGAASAQVVTIDKHSCTVTNGTASANPSVDRRYRQITPTNVELPKSVLDPKTRLELIRTLQAEQGFAMRPFPRGHRGLTLTANGKLNPAGEGYLNMVVSDGLSAKPGDRLVLTDIRTERNKIVFDLNGGPDQKHRFLRHVQIGTGPAMNPVVQDAGQEPLGARLTLVFEDHLPELTGAQVKALLAPLISFDVKTPVQAFTDTLPAKLKDAILDHHVLVGMSTDMVLFAKGPPDRKSRESEGQMPFEEWIYGQPPKDVLFVRINGNNVIRVEVAKMGEAPVIFTKNEVEGLMRTDGTPLEPASEQAKNAQVGDVERDPDRQAPLAPPSLRIPGEKLPNDQTTGSQGTMRPVQFPKPKPAAQPGANPDGEPEAQPPSQIQPPVPDASSSGADKPSPDGGQSK